MKRGFSVCNFGSRGQVAGRRYSLRPAACPRDPGDIRCFIGNELIIPTGKMLYRLTFRTILIDRRS